MMTVARKLLSKMWLQPPTWLEPELILHATSVLYVWESREWL